MVAERVEDRATEDDVDKTIQEIMEEDGWEWDDVHGGEIDKAEVEAARQEEFKHMQMRGIWEVVPVQDCWAKTGGSPTTVKWVDTQKATGMRSRLVARGFKGKDRDREDLFAATPPLEAKRMLMSKAVEQGRKWGAQVAVR